jgi:chromosomal replication initiation ATPase DnaA
VRWTGRPRRSGWSDDLRGADRHKDIALGRHIAMYLIRLALGLSFPRIGRIFNRRDHSSVISAVRKIEAQRFTCAEVRTQLAALVLLDEASGPMSSSALADGAC